MVVSRRSSMPSTRWTFVRLGQGRENSKVFLSENPDVADEIEGEMGDSHVGLQARLMSQALRKLTGAIGRSHAAVIFTNQIREKIGVMFGSPETTTGGRALKFYSSLRLDIRRIASIKEGNEQVGNRTRVKVVKNKCAPPFRMAEFDIMFNEGFSRPGILVDLGEEHGIVQRSGAWYSYGDDVRLGQGRENSKVFLSENPDVADEIEQKLRVLLGIATVDDEADEAEEDSQVSPETAEV
jgi:recombination protein RecA